MAISRTSSDIYPGQHQHVRAAIQSLSGQVKMECILSHLGWTKHLSDSVYLHAGGALGADGPRCDVSVQLSEALELYDLQPPAGAAQRDQGIRASLRLLALAPDRITFPLLAAVYRAPMGSVDFSIFLAGQTGTFKTTLAALCQQHFGAGMNAGRLPANFASTANALESLAFVAKDSLLVVDDFVPIAGRDGRALQAVSERLFRAAGNHQGRSRMSAKGRVRVAHGPRALILATGEEVPAGQSLRARLLIVEVAPGDIDRTMLDQCQQAGRQGHLSTAMGAFISWVASRYDQLQVYLLTRIGELRNEYVGTIHARLPAALAELQGGFEIWLQFALEVGAISTVERSDLQERNVHALHELAAHQVQYHQASDPALAYVSLLRGALAAGRAHVADRSGKKPEPPLFWGWRRKQTGRDWFGQGTRIGWIVGPDLFLDPTLSYQVVQQMAGAERLPLTEQTLCRRLRERGLLASIDAGRQMLKVRRILENYPRQVLHLKSSLLLE